MAPEPALKAWTEKLTAAELKVVFLMRSIQPYQKIEIKLKDNRPGQISVVSTTTLREDFPDGVV